MLPLTDTNGKTLECIAERVIFIGDKADVMMFQRCRSDPGSGFNVVITKSPGRDPENENINILQGRILVLWKRTSRL